MTDDQGRAAVEAAGFVWLTPTRSGCVEVTPCHRPGVIVTLHGTDLDEQIIDRLQEMFADLKVQGYVVDDRSVSIEVIR